MSVCVRMCPGVCLDGYSAIHTPLTPYRIVSAQVLTARSNSWVSISSLHHHSQVCRVARVHARQRDSDTRWGRKRFWKFDRDVKPSISGAAVQTPLSRIGILTEIERSNLHMTPPRGWPVEPDAQRASNRNSSVFRQISVRSSRSKAIASSDFENAAL